MNGKLNSVDKNDFHSFILNNNKQDSCDSHKHMIHLYNKLFNSGGVISGKTMISEYVDGFEKQYLWYL